MNGPQTAFVSQHYFRLEMAYKEIACAVCWLIVRGVWVESSRL